MNTLVAVLGGMLLFAEWKTAQSLPVFIGSVLVVCGGVLLSKSQDALVFDRNKNRDALLKVKRLYL